MKKATSIKKNLLGLTLLIKPQNAAICTICYGSGTDKNGNTCGRCKGSGQI